MASLALNVIAQVCPKAVGLNVISGIGVASLVVIGLTNIYYNVILAWAFYYLFHSFTSVLPWSHCNNVWNTDQCVQSVVNTSFRNFSSE